MGRLKLWMRLDVIITILAVCMVTYHIVSVFYLFVEPDQHKNIHLFFALVILFLSKLEIDKRFWPLTVFFVILSIVATGYIGIEYHHIQDRLGFPTTGDVVVGIMFIILCLEGTRRTYGPVLPVLVLFYIFYSFFGYIFPEPFEAIYFPITKIIGKLAVLQGIYGFVLGISANFIFIFIVFGAMLQVSGATQFFVQVGRLVGKRFRSGPALSAVVTSCLLGTCNSGVSSNIIVTGSFTIPLMKQMGYKPHQAGGIEAAASTGGQIMPPVMGATAFIMAGLTGIPYITICIASIIPACLYYLSCGLYTNFQAAKLKMSYIQEDVDMRELILTAPLFLLPLICLVVIMLLGYTPVYAATWSLFLMVFLSLLRKKTRPSLLQWIEGIKKGAIMGAEIGVSCGLVGAIVASSTMTGLVVKLPSAVAAWSGGTLAYALLITAGVSIILGCGVTVAATYILVAMMAVPALVTMGLSIIQAHLFAYYFAVMSFVTPPLALGALFASRIARSDFFRTAIEATKVAMAGLIVPFLLVVCPAMLLETPFNLLLVFQLISSILLIAALQIVICNYYLTSTSFLERMLFLITAVIFFVFMVKTLYVFFTMGAVLFIFLTVLQRKKSKKTGFLFSPAAIEP